MEDIFYNLARGIAKWHTETFADETESGQIAKLVEEFQEFKESDQSIEELADCFIVAASLSERYKNAMGNFVMKAIVKHAEDNTGFLYVAIVDKMKVNRARKWKKQANGSYHH